MKNPNLQILEIMVEHLEELTDELVFVGGALVGLYIIDKAVPTVRATVDIDCVVEAINQKDYYAIVEKLRKKGFCEDQSSGLICRYRKGELILDLMPTSAATLGFTNQWYAEGVQRKVSIKLNTGKDISIFSVPYFIASKIEAFKSRGAGDYRASHDIEDIIAVFDGDPQIAEKIKRTTGEVATYLKRELQAMLSNEDFKVSVEGHIADRLNTAQRTLIVVDRLRNASS